ncbi:hypothetical protein GIB67_000888 [Kingdonia uniflora]|uniref:Uncharacterized protein n=1 Tax=Kingdonia uniflora TaxID=39325 RepID=A0A7J7MDB2_9MAGN|nr:hypothetical protein GIB67_000888 [Kingdonia uniflora]
MVSSIIQRKLRKTKEKDSDHGRHMKAFNRSKVRDPEVQVMEDDLEPVPQEEEGNSTEENMFELMVSLFYVLAIGETNIAYKRKDGGYGAIIPKGGKAEKLEQYLVEHAREPSIVE